MNRNSSYRAGVNFYQGKRNLVQVSGEFELSDFELKGMKNGIKSTGNETWDLVRVSGEVRAIRVRSSYRGCIVPSVMQHITNS